MDTSAFQYYILSWYECNKRDMPWRNTHDPYKILVSEIMLQQTQVSRVLPKYEQFLKEFPTPHALAKTSDKKLLEVWSGLGYWRRARFLKETAYKITHTHNGIFPKDPKTLQTLPGIGPYTAGAVSCFAFNNTNAFIDTNIRRVYLHFFFEDRYNVPDSDIMPIAQKAVWKQDPRQWHYALFDYGSIELKRTTLNKKSKHYKKQSVFEKSFRSYRTRALKHVLSLPHTSIDKNELLDYVDDLIRSEETDWSAQDVVSALVKDKLLHQKDTTLYVR